MSENSKGEESDVQTPAPEGVNERVKQYNKVVRLAKLRAILLEKISFRMSPEIYGAKKEDLKREINANTKIMGFDVDEGECLASITWTTTITHKKKRLAKCEASYVIIYDGLKKCTEDPVKVFIDHVGKTATYAYFRALYAHLDWSADIGSEPLPVVQFQPKIHPTIKRAVPALTPPSAEPESKKD